MLILEKNQLDSITIQAYEGLPAEVCGLIAGHVYTNRNDEAGILRVVKKVYPLTNTDASAEHFSMDTREQFSALKDMRAGGLELLGNYHSHPATPPRPSDEDIRLAFDPQLTYAILSLAKDTPAFCAYNIEQGIPSAEDVLIYDDRRRELPPVSSADEKSSAADDGASVSGAFNHLFEAVRDEEARRLLLCAKQRVDESGGGAQFFFLPSEDVKSFVFPDAPALIRRVCSYIISYPEAADSLQSIADHFSVNNSYLSSLFKQKTGIGFNDYLTRVKIARAKYYLEYTDRKIGDICDILGFTDHDYFNRLFKKHVGETLAAYRNSHHGASQS